MADPYSSLHVPLLARHVAAADWQHDQSTEPLPAMQDQPRAVDSADSIHLAHFLAELSPAGYGNYDTSCLLDHPHRATHPCLPDNTASSNSAGSITVLEATVKQALPDSIQRVPGLAQAAVVISKQGQPADKQQVLLMAKPQHSLGDALRFSPQALQDDEHCRVLLFEVLLCLQAVHAEGFYLGNLSPDSVWLTHGRQGLSSLSVSCGSILAILASGTCSCCRIRANVQKLLCQHGS